MQDEKYDLDPRFEINLAGRRTKFLSNRFGNYWYWLFIEGIGHMQDITSVLIATIAAISLIFCYTISTIRDVVKNTSYKGYTVFGNALFVIPFIYSLVFFFQSNEDSSENGGDKLVHGSGGIFPAAGGIKPCHL